MQPDAFSPGDRLLAAFARWAAEDRTEQAAGARSRERSLRDQASGEATWAGLLVDLGEAKSELTVEVGRRRLKGRLVGVGRDFCVLERDSRGPSVIPSFAIVAAWHDAPPSGSRFPHLDISFAAAMAGLAADRSPVCISLDTGSQVTGDLIACGSDLLTVRGEPPARRVVHLQTVHVEMCEIR